MALGLTIPSASGTAALTFKVLGQKASDAASSFLTYTVLGQSAGNWATAFSKDVENNPTVVDLSTGSGVAPGSAVVLNEIFTSQTSPDVYNLSFGGEYLAALSGSPITINGSAAGGETVVATAGITWNDDAAGGNNVTFIYGADVFNGSTVSGAAGDTITGSEGWDTINTGVNNSTVFGGFGHSKITLNDTLTSGVGGVVYLGDGNSTVYANGTFDEVVTGVSGQLVVGDSATSASGSFLDVVIGSKTGSLSFTGNDTVYAGSGITAVFDSIGGNTIHGGSGALDFIGENRLNAIVGDTIVAGTGETNIFAATAENLTFQGATSAPAIFVTAGSGNETLNGSAAGSQLYFTDTNTVDSATTNTSITGSNFYNDFNTGTGNETINAGTGENIFNLTSADGHITINDFNLANSFDFVSFGTTADQNAALASETTDGTNLSLTLNDGTTVTFTGISDINAFNSHIIGGS
jgi:hypothetical protein